MSSWHKKSLVYTQKPAETDTQNEGLDVYYVAHNFQDLLCIPLQAGVATGYFFGCQCNKNFDYSVAIYKTML